jgi:outer membrane scaffolding protein for murein synthesis (MipA/OmpV family)
VQIFPCSVSRIFVIPLISFALFSGAKMAMADEILDQQLEQTGSGELPSKGAWNITLGMGAGYSPRFEGAKSYHFTPIPYGSVSYAGIGALGPEGIGANVLRAGGFRLGLLVGYSGGRDQSDDPHLNGLGNISGSLQMGGYAAYQWNAFELRAQARQAVTHASNGMVGSLGLTYALHPIERWRVKLGPQLAFADGDHMKKFFSVSADQSRGSGLATYSASGGLSDVAFGINTTFQLTNNWLVFGIAKVAEIIGDPANSPIVQRKEQAFVGTGLAYHF